MTKKIGNETSSVEEVAEVRPVKSPKKKEQQIYIGPTIEGVVRRNAIFLNEIPEKLKEQIRKQPELLGLVITMDDLPEAQKQITMKQGMYYSLLKKAQNH